MYTYRYIRNNKAPSRFIKNLARIALALILLATWFIWATPIHATLSNPTSLSLSDIHVNRNLVQSGDMLIYFSYNIAYSSIPTTVPASNSFIFRLYDGTTEIGRNVPYAYNDAGYGYGISAIYFNASNAPAWNGTYTLSLEGNPIQFTSPMSYSIALSTANYTTLTSVADNQEDVRSNIVTMIQELEVQWNHTLLTQSSSVTYLATAGAGYLVYAIPNIKNIAPKLFSASILYPDFTTRNYTTNNLSAQYRERYNGTFIGNFTSGLGSLFGTGASFAGGVLVLILCVACIIFTAVKMGSALPGFIGAILCQLMCYLMGWLAPGFMGIIGFFFVIYIGYWWFFLRG